MVTPYISYRGKRRFSVNAHIINLRLRKRKLDTENKDTTENDQFFVKNRSFSIETANYGD